MNKWRARIWWPVAAVLGLLGLTLVVMAQGDGRDYLPVVLRGPVSTGDPVVKINFQPAAAEVPPGYWPDSGAVWATLMFMGVGFFGASFPVVMAHGRAFLPPHLTGRGVALINLCGIGAAGVMQVLTGRLHAGLQPATGIVNSAPPSLPYLGLFVFYAVFVAAGLTLYLFSRDRTD